MRREEDAVQKITDRGAWLDWMAIGALDASEIEEALNVTARGMRDNPLTVAVFGDGPEQRHQRFRRFMGRVARVLGWGPNMLVARDADDDIAGVCPLASACRAPLSNYGCCPPYCRTDPTSPDTRYAGSGSGSDEIPPSVTGTSARSW